MSIAISLQRFSDCKKAKIAKNSAIFSASLLIAINAKFD